jgi:hypothetical protein
MVYVSAFQGYADSGFQSSRWGERAMGRRGKFVIGDFVMVSGFQGFRVQEPRKKKKGKRKRGRSSRFQS